MVDRNIIYLIDDDDVYRKVITRYLEGINQSVMEFPNGQSFLLKIKSDIENDTLPDIIFLDLKMPEMGGWEVVDELINMQNQYDVKLNIHIVTSSISKFDTELFKNNYKEHVCYHVKPISKVRFVQILENYCPNGKK